MRFHLLFYILLMLGMLPDFCIADIVITNRVARSDDDAEEVVSGINIGTVFTSSDDLAFGNQNGVGQWVGLRFRDLAIPQGATINSAGIMQTKRPDKDDVGTLLIPIQGQLSPDTLEFGTSTTATTQPLTTRPLTVAQVLWNADPWVTGDPNVAAATTTPDLSSIVQEIVNQSGWASGNSIVFLFRNDPAESSERVAVSFDTPLIGPTAAALLTIDYTVQSVPEPAGTVLGMLILSAGIGLRRKRP